MCSRKQGRGGGGGGGGHGDFDNVQIWEDFFYRMASPDFINIIEIAWIIAFWINNIGYKWYKTNVSIILWFVIFHNYTMYAPLIPDDQPPSSTTLSKKKKRIFFLHVTYHMGYMTCDTFHGTHEMWYTTRCMGEQQSFHNFSCLALMVLERLCFKYNFTEDHWLN